MPSFILIVEFSYPVEIYGFILFLHIFPYRQFSILHGKTYPAVNPQLTLSARTYPLEKHAIMIGDGGNAH